MQPHTKLRSSRRIVSKSLYLKQVGGKLIGWWFGTFIILTGIFGCLIGLLLTYFLLMFDRKLPTGMELFYFFGVIGLVIGGSIYTLRIGWRETKAAVKAPLDLPLTRSTVEQLPPEESLVRGASEPTLPQETILLRAAQDYTTPAEQLLRAGQSETDE